MLAKITGAVVLDELKGAVVLDKFEGSVGFDKIDGLAKMKNAPITTAIKPIAERMPIPTRLEIRPAGFGFTRFSGFFLDASGKTTRVLLVSPDKASRDVLASIGKPSMIVLFSSGKTSYIVLASSGKTSSIVLASSVIPMARKKSTAIVRDAG